MDARSDSLQLFVKQGLKGQAAQGCRESLELGKARLVRTGLGDRSHKLNSCPALSQRISRVLPVASALVCSNSKISFMIRSASAGLVWVM